jgi:ParB family chromosome partitioning protein
VARKQALGRGLKALIPEAPTPRSGLTEVAVDRLHRNENQPRHHFDPDALAELAASLQAHGVLQPLLVSDDGQGGFLIIAGERRWRAAKLAGLQTVPVVVRERIEEVASFELALVENLQRRDLTPMEEARAFEHLRTTAGLSQVEIAEKVGIDRSTVANALRLLKLPEEVQALVDNGALAGGHARALLAFATDEERLSWAMRAAEQGLSVRDLEREAAASRSEQSAPKRRARQGPQQVDPNLRAAEDQLGRRLGARVEIRPTRRGGRIVISCSDNDEMVRVFDMLLKEGT